MAKNRGEVNRSGPSPMDRTRGFLPCHSVDRETPIWRRVFHLWAGRAILTDRQ